VLGSRTGCLTVRDRRLADRLVANTSEKRE
jgi:hypothetical protein